MVLAGHQAAPPPPPLVPGPCSPLELRAGQGLQGIELGALWLGSGRGRGAGLAQEGEDLWLHLLGPPSRGWTPPSMAVQHCPLASGGKPRPAAPPLGSHIITSWSRTQRGQKRLQGAPGWLARSEPKAGLGLLGIQVLLTF